jgi:hypothetical protein
MVHGVQQRRAQMLLSARLGMLCALTAWICPATTLELLGFDRLIDQSTQVVRGQVGSCAGAYRGSMIYTHCTVEVTETLKGAPVSQARFSVPGGKVGNIRQSIAGAPQFQPGVEYVLFLWTSASGFTQVMGLSQGKFEVGGAGSAQTLSRNAVPDVTMLDGMGQEVRDAGVRMTLTSLRQRMADRLSRSVTR